MNLQEAKKRCYELTKYFYMTDEEINEIYDFLSVVFL